ncbi:MAG: zinc ribbon domain-containing protein [Clostridia bacterium]|nr:zinc ribbon domain-containing protein [Clostridia bacterium]
MGFFDQASKKFAEVQKKTGDTIAVYKLQSQIKNIEEEIQQIYATIGEVCYAAHKSGKSPEGLDSLFENIDSMKASIAELNDDIDRLNQIVRCPDCGGPVDLGVKFCPNCGCKIPEELLPKIETCPNCGNIRGEGDRFCEKCGHMYGAEVPAEQPEAAEEVPAEEPAEEAPAEGEEA